MVPTKIKTNMSVASRGSIITRSHNQNAILQTKNRIKRKANSPAKGMPLKRSALGDVTNAFKKSITTNDKLKRTIDIAKKVAVHTQVLPAVRTAIKSKLNNNEQPPAELTKKIVTRASLRNIQVATQTVSKLKETIKVETSKVKTRLSNEFDKTEESLYTSALENL